MLNQVLRYGTLFVCFFTASLHGAAQPMKF